jgi:hypothetical protein
MPEYHDSDHDKKVAEKKKSADIDDKADIIELSDIAVGTSQEDDAIIELTEELIGEAMNGISGATYEDFSEEEHTIDLSRESVDRDTSFDRRSFNDDGDSEPVQNDLSVEIERDAADVEDHLEKELDDFFGQEQEMPPKADPKEKIGANDNSASRTVAVAQESELLAALEIMIRNKYGDRIHHMIIAAIDRIVSEEIDRIKKNITESLKF